MLATASKRAGAKERVLSCTSKVILKRVHGDQGYRSNLAAGTFKMNPKTAPSIKRSLAMLTGRKSSLHLRGERRELGPVVNQVMNRGKMTSEIGVTTTQHTAIRTRTCRIHFNRFRIRRNAKDETFQGELIKQVKMNIRYPPIREMERIVFKQVWSSAGDSLPQHKKGGFQQVQWQRQTKVIKNVKM
eukprot:Skav205941  [mRNA]  locus=scaffold442:19815:20375:+ [translate_table: standard]